MNSHINIFLSVLMLVASVLPALHALGHFYSDSGSALEKQELVQSDSRSAVDCDLCDFKFSSHDTLHLHNYHLHLPHKEVPYIISLTETVNLYPASYFSLRAPPAATV